MCCTLVIYLCKASLYLFYYRSFNFSELIVTLFCMCNSYHVSCASLCDFVDIFLKSFARVRILPSVRNALAIRRRSKEMRYGMLEKVGSYFFFFFTSLSTSS